MSDAKSPTPADIRSLIKQREYDKAFDATKRLPPKARLQAHALLRRLVEGVEEELLPRKRKRARQLLLKVVERLIEVRLDLEALELTDRLQRGTRGVNRAHLDKWKGLALARLGHRKEAREILEKLCCQERYADADTLGILARTCMDCYDLTGDRKDLIRSRDLYVKGYKKAQQPSDRFYTAINSAAKSMLLATGKLAHVEKDRALYYCQQAEAALEATPREERDYWHGATFGEVKLLRADYKGAGQEYRKAVVRYPYEIGSHCSTWLEAKRLLRALDATDEEQGLIWEAFSHILDAPPHASVLRPPFRRLRVYAFDPSLARSMETAVMNEVTLHICWESHPDDAGEPLPEGPVGEYLEVIDYDPASRCFYEPVDLDDYHLLATDGMAPSEAEPKFHQQMVYAVAMNVIDHFERALGRRALWAPHRFRGADGKIAQQFVRRLRIYPHAVREANAFYSPKKKALLFGYFPAEADDPKILRGGIVFSCLSHDIVAHEVTHALLDGLHPRFVEPSNRDVLAFHEAFADIVALFQHFSHPEVLRHEIARSRGDLASGTVLGQLAQEFGRAIGKYGALRDAIGETDSETGEWRLRKPDPSKLEKTDEPHARGSILVAAVFDAFLSIYRARISDLLRIATGGSGIIEPGAIHPDLVDRLAAEASKTATHLLHICIRALDYCPPVDITFGDYLRAVITADMDMVFDDRHHYRLAIIEAFQRRGIYPHDVPNLSVESLVWRPPRGDGIDLSPLFDSTWSGPTLRPEWRPTDDRRQLYEKMRRNARAVHWWLVNHCPPDYAEEIGLSLSVDAPGSFYRKNGVPRVKVHSVRVARRGTPSGDLVTDLVVEILQCRRGYMDSDKQDEIDRSKHLPDDHPKGDFKFRGGCTLLIDPDTYQVRYAISKHILSGGRLRRQRAFRSGESSSLYATYFGDLEHDPKGREPFALLHRSI